MVQSLIPNNEVIPEVNTDLFADHESRAFAVGIVAIGDYVIPGRESEYMGYTLLRGNVYAGQMNYMPGDQLNADGTETDADDRRSIHFTVIENALTSPRVVGAMRLIVKQDSGDRILPVEEHYPEAFVDGPAPAGSTEVSRLICRHENRMVQSTLKWPLFTAGLTQVLEQKLGPVYGAVEESLERRLTMEGVPVTALAPAKYIEEFNAVKLPLRIDVDGLNQKIETDRADLLGAMQAAHTNFIYSGTVKKPRIAQAQPVA